MKCHTPPIQFSVIAAIFVIVSIIVVDPIVYFYWYKPIVNQYISDQCSVVNCTSIHYKEGGKYFKVFYLPTVDRNITQHYSISIDCNNYQTSVDCYYEPNDVDGTFTLRQDYESNMIVFFVLFNVFMVLFFIMFVMMSVKKVAKKINSNA